MFNKIAVSTMCALLFMGEMHELHEPGFVRVLGAPLPETRRDVHWHPEAQNPSEIITPEMIVTGSASGVSTTFYR